MTFDPYHGWLGIRPEESASGGPNHYRLLGLALFEDNPAVIDSAADRQMAHLRTFQNGPQAALSQRLLGEVTRARICLLDRQQRTQYDAELRAAMIVPTPENPGVCLAPPIEPGVDRDQSPAPARRRPKNQMVEIAKIVAGGLAGILISVLLLRYVFLMDITGLLPVPSRQTAEQFANRDAVVQRSPSAQPAKVLPIEEESPSPIAEKAPSESPTADASSDIPPKGDQPSAKAPKQKKRGKRKAVEPASTNGATIAVSRMKPVPIGDDSAMPVELRGGTRFDWIETPTAVNVELGRLEFTVENSGIVFLVADWNYEGNRSGNWTEEAKSKDQLVQEGWTYVGRCPWGGTDEKPLELLKKHCVRGESYTIRVNKYWPPLPFVPPTAAPVAGLAPSPAALPPRPTVLAERRLPIPSPEQQAAVRQTLEEIYGLSRLKTDDQRRKVAAELRQVAVDSIAKPVEQFVTLRQTAELSQEVGDAGLLSECIDALAQRFDVDLLQIESAMYSQCAAEAQTPEQMESLVAAARPSVQMALADEQFDAAARLTEAVVAACNRAGGREFRKVVGEGQKVVRRRQQAWQAYERALEELNLEPHDPAANLAAGKWLCQERGDWIAALPHLAQADDPLLAQAAKLELAKPTETKGLLAVAEAWHAAGQGPPHQPLWLVHAQDLFEQLKQRPFDGLVSAQVQQRLDELAKDPNLKSLIEQSNAAAALGSLRRELPTVVRRHCLLLLSLESDDLFPVADKQYVRDLSGQANHGLLEGPTPVAGQAGMALEFDGKDDYLECPDAPSLNPSGALSVCAWVQPRSWVHPQDAADYVISKDDWKNGDRGYVLRFAAAGQPDFTLGVGSNWSGVRGPNRQPLGEWVHLAAIYDGQRKVLLVNGVEQAVYPETARISASPVPLRIGRGAFAPQRRFHGLIDEVAIFDLALTADDIRIIYGLGRAGTPLAR